MKIYEKAMIRNLKRTNDFNNASEGWQFELTSTGETYYYMTGPERTDYYYACSVDANGHTCTVKTDRTYTHSASTFMTCYRGKEPEETEITWSLMEYLPITPENAESRALRVLLLGERREEPVVYV